MGQTRTRNEDALLQRPGRGLAVVADGMGGHAAGDIASRIAVDVVDDRGAHLPDSDLGPYLRDTIHEAHQAILRAADADSDLEGMGTTLTLLRIDPSDQTGLIAHVGDSRAYRWRDGTLEQLTRDQTWVQDQIDAGLITPEQGRTHPYSSMITCALGIRDIDLDVQLIDAETRAGDLFLLCSDGLTAALTDDEIRGFLSDPPTPEDAEPHPARGPDEEAAALRAIADALVDAANDAGGPDNITVALVSLQDD